MFWFSSIWSRILNFMATFCTNGFYSDFWFLQIFTPQLLVFPVIADFYFAALLSRELLSLVTSVFYFNNDLKGRALVTSVFTLMTSRPELPPVHPWSRAQGAQCAQKEPAVEVILVRIKWKCNRRINTPWLRFCPRLSEFVPGLVCKVLLYVKLFFSQKWRKIASSKLKVAAL